MNFALYIDGEWISEEGRSTQPVLDPASGNTIGDLPIACLPDLDRALESAQRGFNEWHQVSAYDRSKILRGAAVLIRKRNEAIAMQLTGEQGKPLSEARAEVASTADMFDWFAEEGRRAYGRIIPGRFRGHRQFVWRVPIGPVAAFSPWNFPGVTPARKIAAALAAGCSCIIKPAEETPGTALELARALCDAGLPKGVLNVVFGDPGEISTYLVRSPIIRKVSLTGSTAAGRKIAALAAEGPKPATMELGGHAPVIVDETYDPEKAELAAIAKFRNAGQICLSPTRFFVHESIQKNFAQGLTKCAMALKVGDGRDPTTNMGPLANARRLENLESLIEDACRAGAQLMCGGQRLGNRGFFYAPTILVDVPETARIMNEEPFGPIAIVNSFSATEDAISCANRLPLGLAAYVMSDSESFVNRVTSQLQAGAIGINHYAVAYPETPFGGVKDSGYGSEGGREGLDAYLVTRFESHA